MKTSPQRLRSIVGCALVFSALVLIGCSNKAASEKNLVLSGKVTYKGNPVTGGKMTLIPADKTTMVQVNAEIYGDGTYSIVAPGTGEMKITIDTEGLKGMPDMSSPYGKMAKPGMRQPKMDPKQVRKYVKIPKKYSDPNSTTLKVNITKENGGKNVYDCELAD